RAIPVPSPSRTFILPPRRSPQSTLFPYTTLFRSVFEAALPDGWVNLSGGDKNKIGMLYSRVSTLLQTENFSLDAQYDELHKLALDRKSTRLNSSHVSISYAVFCLKKKNKNNKYTQ